MRIQEHLFQGYFGYKKKEDSVKYYNERVGKLKGLHSELDAALDQLSQILENHENKITAYLEFLKGYNKQTLDTLKKEIKVIEEMFIVDEGATELEDRYILKVEDSLGKLSKNETSTELNALEKEILEDISSLHQLLTTLAPLWKAQLQFVNKNDDEILSDKSTVKIFSDVLKEEGDILKIEQNLMKKIDIKTGSLLRKTTLLANDVDRTRDMGMAYRDIRHIR